MKILVVIGGCLRINSSANLCHLSYIRGMIEAGHNVDLLTGSPKGFCSIDESIKIPDVDNIYEYECSKYEQYGSRKSSTAKAAPIAPPVPEESTATKASLKSEIAGNIKRTLRRLYGVYSTDIIWVKNALRFRSDKAYDIVISIAYPPASHLLTEKLLKKKRIKAGRWIQIWEDPWGSDLFGVENPDAIKKEEYRLTGLPDEVVYVSPITMMYQKESFPDSADKMKWFPLPSYYSNDENDAVFDKNCYGYFGDYGSGIRNLKPFYEAAGTLGVNAVICGNSDLQLKSTEAITINPRLPLNELKIYEDKANVLIFLCNLRGGQIPGKIYQYSATSKNILFILDGTEEEKKTLREYFEKYNRYFFCENTVESISKAITDIENGRIGNIENNPLDCFDPVKIIDQILG